MCMNLHAGLSSLPKRSWIHFWALHVLCLQIAAIVYSRQNRVSFDTLWLEDLYEKVILETQGSKITPLVVNPGRVLLTSSRLYFQPYNNVESVSWCVTWLAAIIIHRLSLCLVLYSTTCSFLLFYLLPSEAIINIDVLPLILQIFNCGWIWQCVTLSVAWMKSCNSTVLVSRMYFLS
jgi:hypothetical protein